MDAIKEQLNTEQLLNEFITWASQTGIKLVIAAFLLWIGFKVIKKVLYKMNQILTRRNFDQTLLSFFDSFLSITLKFILLFLLAGYIGFDITGIAAILASAGLAIGLALQGALSNFAGGVIILFIRPFKVGDYIESHNHSGTVEQIGIFYTYLATIDNKQILIPNGTLANDSIINYSAKDTRRIDLTFSVSYSEDILKVKSVLNGIINRNEKIQNIPEPFVGLAAHSASSVDFIVKVWTQKDDYWVVYYDLLEQVKIRFDEENIEIPYPQLDLHFKNQLLKEHTN